VILALPVYLYLNNVSLKPGAIAVSVFPPPLPRRCRLTEPVHPESLPLTIYQRFL
jgi:hypothetical protein